MKQIKIGTCVPGTKAEEWLKGFVGKGFETFSINFHMSLEGTDLDKLALTTDKLLAGTDSKITTLGYYCNPIQYAEHRKTLEKVICTAEKFGATHVSTFAGAWEGKPVESAYEEFGKVFRELADLAEEKGVKLGIENCLMDGTWEHATCNIGFNPKAWEVMFEEVKNDNFGLEWEPTHQIALLHIFIFFHIRQCPSPADLSYFLYYIYISVLLPLLKQCFHLIQRIHTCG